MVDKAVICKEVAKVVTSLSLISKSWLNYTMWILVALWAIKCHQYGSLHGMWMATWVLPPRIKSISVITYKLISINWTKLIVHRDLLIGPTLGTHSIIQLDCRTSPIKNYPLNIRMSSLKTHLQTYLTYKESSYSHTQPRYSCCPNHHTGYQWFEQPPQRSPTNWREGFSLWFFEEKLNDLPTF